MLSIMNASTFRNTPTFSINPGFMTIVTASFSCNHVPLLLAFDMLFSTQHRRLLFGIPGSRSSRMISDLEAPFQPFSIKSSRVLSNSLLMFMFMNTNTGPKSGVQEMRNRICSGTAQKAWVLLLVPVPATGSTSTTSVRVLGITYSVPVQYFTDSTVTYCEEATVHTGRTASAHQLTLDTLLFARIPHPAFRTATTLYNVLE